MPAKGRQESEDKFEPRSVPKFEKLGCLERMPKIEVLNLFGVMDLWETLDKKLGQKKKVGQSSRDHSAPQPYGLRDPHPHPLALQATLRVPQTHGHTSGVFWSQVRLTSQAAPLTLMNRLESLAGNCPPPVSMWYFIRKPMPRTPLTAMGIWKVSGELDRVPLARSSGQQGHTPSLP